MALAQIFGAILKIGGGVMQGLAQKSETEAAANKFGFDAQVAENNAKLAAQDQILAAEAGAVERTNITRATNEVQGEGRVGYASGNVQLDEGTPLEFDIAAEELAATERERSKDRQAVKIQKLETEKQSLLASAHMLRKAKKRTRKNANLQFGGSVLSSIGGAAGSMGGK